MFTFREISVLIRIIGQRTKEDRTSPDDADWVRYGFIFSKIIIGWEPAPRRFTRGVRGSPNSGAHLDQGNGLSNPLWGFLLEANIQSKGKVISGPLSQLNLLHIYHSRVIEEKDVVQRQKQK